MGEQRNLTEENVEELEAKLEKMQETNPELEYRFWKQERGLESLSESEYDPYSNKALFEKLESLERKINLIFGGHILINGSFKNLSPASEKPPPKR